MGWTLVKAVSLAYLLGGLGLSLASVAWWALRGRLAPARRADAGFTALAAASLGSLWLCTVIAVGVITRSIRMSTPYFHRLMSGSPALLITLLGWTVLLLSLVLVVRSALQARLGARPAHSDLADGVVLRRSAAVATASLLGVRKPELWVNPAYWDGLTAGRAAARAAPRAAALAAPGQPAQAGSALHCRAVLRVAVDASAGRGATSWTASLPWMTPAAANCRSECT